MYHANVNKNLTEENVIQINDGITINVDVGVKKHHICEKDYIWNSATWNYKNGKYFGSIIDNSVITCETVIKLYMREKSYSSKF